MISEPAGAEATPVSDIFMASGPAVSKQTSADHCGSAVRSAADWLCLAATPAFAVMALLTALGGGEPDMLCAAMQHASPLRGMATMYLLMSTFHSAPWLRLILPPVTGDQGIKWRTRRPMRKRRFGVA